MSLLLFVILFTVAVLSFLFLLAAGLAALVVLWEWFEEDDTILWEKLCEMFEPSISKLRSLPGRIYRMRGRIY